MSELKKYCGHCVFLKIEVDLRFYNSIIFRNKDKRINCHDNLCIANLESSNHVTETPIYKIVKPDFVVDDPFELNKDFDCKFYKENIFFRFLAKLFKKQFWHVG
jgi:hypothetical protein